MRIALTYGMDLSLWSAARAEEELMYEESQERCDRCSSKATHIVAGQSTCDICLVAALDDEEEDEGGVADRVQCMYRTACYVCEHPVFGPSGTYSDSMVRAVIRWHRRHDTNHHHIKESNR